MEVALVPAALIVLAALSFLFARRRSPLPKMVSFRVVPPAYGSKPESKDELIALVKQLIDSSPSKLFAPKLAITFEAIFSAQEGTLFLITLPLSLSSAFKNQLIAYWPQLELSKVRAGTGYTLTDELKTKVNSWHPLTGLEEREGSSVIESLANSLGTLKARERVGWQLNISSTKRPLTLRMASFISRLCYLLVKTVIVVSIELIEDPATARQRSLNRALKIERRASQLKKDLSLSIRTFTASGREPRLSSLNLALDSVLKANGLSSYYFAHGRSLDAFSRRSAGRSFAADNTLLGQLFDFPAPGGVWQLNAEVNLSENLPANIKRRSFKPQVVLGLNTASEDSAAIGLSAAERHKHTLVIGGTGMGKSTLLAYSFLQDVHDGRGTALVDPHGDLALAVLSYIPKDRIKDVVYIDPAEIRYPVALNLLELPNNLSQTELALAKDFICEAVVSIFRKVFSEDDSGGHRIEYVLRNAVHTAFTIPDATLFSVHKLLTNDLYRAPIVARLSDDGLKDFWYGEFNKAGSYQRVKMISGVTAKLGRFQRSVVASRMIGYPRSTINFEQVLKEHKIIVCNLSKGSIGEDTSSLLGLVLLAKLQLASWRRAAASARRSPYMLYVDEFQQFNSPIFMQLISEARKLGLYLTLAEQTTAYQSSDEANILLANVGNIISFRSASDIDRQRLTPLFSQHLSANSLANLNPYSFYLKSAGMEAMPPVSATTILIRGSGSRSIADKIIKSSHKSYSYPYLSQTAETVVLPRVPLKN